MSGVLGSAGQSLFYGVLARLIENGSYKTVQAVLDCESSALAFCGQKCGLLMPFCRDSQCKLF